jgi:purine-nucleoside phosphorylase
MVVETSKIGIALQRRVKSVTSSVPDQRNSEKSEGILLADVAVGALTLDAIAKGGGSEIDVVRQADEQLVVIAVEISQQVKAQTKLSVVIGVDICIAVRDDGIDQVARAERMRIADAA